MGLNKTFALLTAMVLASLGTIYPASAFFFKKIVDTNTLRPSGGLFNLNLVNAPAVDGINVAFLADPGEVWVSTISGAGQHIVITPNRPIPGGGGALFQMSYANFVQIHGDNVIVVGEDCFLCNAGRGIYTVSAEGGTVKRLVDITMIAPGTNTTFGGFADYHANLSRVVFYNNIGSAIYQVPLAGGSTTRVSTGCAQGDYCGSDQPTISLLDLRVLAHSCNGLSNCLIDEYTRGGAGPFVDVTGCDGRPGNGVHAPHTPSGYCFDPFFLSFNMPVIDETSDHRFIVFKGESADANSPRIYGIYSRGPAGFFALADSRTAVPSGSGNFYGPGFSDPGTNSLAAANGIVIFRGVDEAGKLGIYAVRATGGPITKIIAQGDPIAGRNVDTAEPLSLKFRRDGFDGTTLVFLAQYAGGGRGLFSTRVTLP